jgi:hypothetical protein
MINYETLAYRENVLTTYGVYVKYYNDFFKQVNGIEITDVTFNPPATIVFWSDGSKTVVKCMEGDTFDKQTGLAMAICKRIFSDKFHSEFRRWCNKDE